MLPRSRYDILLYSLSTVLKHLFSCWPPIHLPVFVSAFVVRDRGRYKKPWIAHLARALALALAGTGTNQARSVDPDLTLNPPTYLYESYMSRDRARRLARVRRSRSGFMDEQNEIDVLIDHKLVNNILIDHMLINHSCPTPRSSNAAQCTESHNPPICPNPDIKHISFVS